MKLFSSGKIGTITIKNRIMRSATFEGMASREGAVTKELIALYTDLAKGGTGLIITGAAAIDERYTVGSRCACLNDDSFIAGQKKLVAAVHDYSDVKIGPQLAHNGRLGTHPRYLPVAPSPIPYNVTNKVPKELTTDEIRELIKKFAAAGRRAYECEYDMVQLHGAHGYLLSSFVSPYTNKRTDEFGGTAENRTKILVDIYHALRDEVGKNFPIGIKLQVIDGIPGGLTVDDGLEITKVLADTGFDAVEPSGGSAELQAKSPNTLPSKMVKSKDDENYLLDAAKKIKPVLKDVPLCLVGGIKDPLSAEEILQAGTCDFISLSRPLIYDPNLPNKWKSGEYGPSECRTCNSCLIAIFIGQPVHCVVKKKLERKRQKKS